MPRVKYLRIKDAARLGISLSQYPSFSATGSVRGMRKLYYGQNALLVQYRGFIYNVPKPVYDAVPNH